MKRGKVNEKIIIKNKNKEPPQKIGRLRIRRKFQLPPIGEDK